MMASDVEMSLEEIITKNKKNRPPKKQLGGMRSRGSFAQKPTAKTAGILGGNVADARNKLIKKRRTQIGDLRDKLALMSKKKDARVKLEQLRLKKFGPERGLRNVQENRRLQRNMLTNIHRGFSDLSRQVRSGPLPALPKFSIHEARQIYTKPKLSSLRSDRLNQGYRITPKPILRTVENDVYMKANPIVIDDDYDLPVITRSNAFNLKIVTHNDKAVGLTTKSAEKRAHERMPPSILKKRPMAALRMDRDRRPSPAPSPPPSPPRAQPEYRIIVSNLRSSVSGTDIQELFGDIGGLVESRLVRAGTAEVIYASLEDAQRAVELYHNRQLDGQPMNCLLVNPRTKLANSGRLGSAKPALPPSGASSIVPDIDTFHKVLFSNRR